MIAREVSDRLAEDSGRRLGEVGVRPEDARWIEIHAETIASLGGPPPRRERGDRLERALLRAWRMLSGRG